MKKLINLIALVMLVSTNVLTPFSYADVETPEVNPGSELETVDESLGEVEEIPEINEETPELLPEEKGELEQGNQEDETPENVLSDAQDDVDASTVEETEKMKTSDDQRHDENRDEAQVGDHVQNQDDDDKKGEEKTMDVEIKDETILGIGLDEDAELLKEMVGDIHMMEEGEYTSITVTHNANGGQFSDGSEEKVAVYPWFGGGTKKYSHTQNINDAGVKQSNYSNNWTNSHIRGSGRTSANSDAHVITIPYATKLKIIIEYGGESTSYDWVCMWTGSHPTYTAASNCSTSVSGKLGGTHGTKTYEITGDTVTFAFKSDGSNVGDGYGYYAVVEGEGYTTEENVLPEREGYGFMGWTKNVGGEGEIVGGVDDNGRGVLNTEVEDNSTLYAKWDKCYNYEVTSEENKEVKLSRYSTYCTGKIEIPEEVDGYTVTAIGDNVFKGRELNSVIMPDTIRTIGQYAFYNSKLSEIELPSMLTGIGQYAFYGNQLAGKLVIPEGLINIGNYAFSGNKLAELYLPNSLISIGNYAFYNNNLENISIGSGLEMIGNYAFAYNKLEEIELPNSLVSIGYDAFYNSNLKPVLGIRKAGGVYLSNDPYNTYINISDEGSCFGLYTGNGYGEIQGYNVFQCGVDVEIPSNIGDYIVTNIGSSAFRNLGIKSVKISDTVTYIGEYAFASNQIRNVELGSGVENIGYSAFVNNNLKEIYLPDSLSNIQYYAFAGNSSNPVKGIRKLGTDGLSNGDSSNIIIVTPEMSEDTNSLCFVVNASGQITNYNGGDGCSSDVVIPSEINGVQITSIGGNAFYNKGITSVIIPDTVTSIGNSAFQNNSLKEVEVPGSVTSIGSYAFAYNDLEEVEVPGSVTSIGSYAFAYNNIEEVEMPGSVTSIGNGAFSYNNIKEVKIGSGVETIGDYAFAYNSIEEVEMPGSVTSIGNGAFSYNNIEEIGLPVSLTSISGSAFYGNAKNPVIGYRYNGMDGLMNNDSNLKIEVRQNQYLGCFAVVSGVLVGYRDSGECGKDVVVPSEISGEVVMAIGDSIFRNKGIRSIVLPDTLVRIGNYAFRDNKLKEVMIPGNVTSIGDGAFSGNQLTGDLSVPAGVKNIGAYAFYNNKITGLSLPDSLISIGNYAFQNNQISGELIIPEGITNIGQYVFSNNKIVGLSLPDSLISIGNYAFQNNQISGELIIPEGITNIGQYVFTNNRISEVKLPSTLTGIGNYAFSGNLLTELELSDSVVSIGNYAFCSKRSHPVIGYRSAGTQGLTNSTSSCLLLWTGESNSCYVINSAGTITKYYAWAKGCGTGLVEIPSVISGIQVKSIGDSAFKNAGITGVIIPSTVTSIGYSAFSDNYLEELAIPGNVTTIGVAAFLNNNIETLTIGSKVTSIGVSAFRDNKLKEVVIPGNVTTIDAGAFSGNQLISVKLGNKVKTIGQNAFAGNQLTEIDMTDAVKTIGNNAFVNNKRNPVVGYRPSGTAGLTNNDYQHLQIRSSKNGCYNITLSGKITKYYGGISGCNVGLVEIPSVISGIQVKSIGDSAFYNLGITGVIIPEGVTNIGNSAFYSNKLTELILPSTLTGIGSSAFYNNKLSGELIIPEGVTTIGSYAFEYNNLAAVKLPNSLTSIGYSAFEYNQIVGELIIPEGVTTIGSYAFCSNKSNPVVGYRSGGSIGLTNNTDSCLLVRVDENDDTCYSITSTGEILKYYGGARGCGTGLVEVPSVISGIQVKSIGGSAFYNLGITGVIIPEGVETIGGGAFEYNNLEAVKLPNSLTSIGNGAFYSNKLTELILPSTLISIGDGAFEYNQIVGELIIPEGVTTIGSSAFYGNKLTELILPSTLTGIGGSAFEYNQIVGELIIPEGVTSIGNYAFEYNNLAAVKLPNSLTSIGYSAFCDQNGNYDYYVHAYRENGSGGIEMQNNPCLLFTQTQPDVVRQGCYIFDKTEGDILAYRVGSGCGTGLVEIPAEIDGVSVRSIGDYAFYGLGITGVIIPEGVINIGDSAFRYNSLEYVEVKSGKIGDYAFYGGSYTLNTVIIGTGVTEIGYEAFYGKGIRELEIKEGVKKIGEYAFYGNQIKRVVLPNSIEDIGNYAFYGGNPLEYVEVKSGKIGDYAFYGGSYTLNTVIIGTGVTEIGNYAFAYRGVKNVEIKEGVQKIGDYAFDSHRLTSLEVPGSVKEIGYEAFRSNDGPYYFRSLVLGSGIEIIGDYAFAYNRLSELVLPDSVKVIGNNAFYGGHSLRVINIPDSLEKIGGSTFQNYNNSSLRVLGIITKPVGDIEITYDPYVDFARGYSITYDTQGGTEIQKQVYLRGDNIKTPTNPTRTGYSFVGWDSELPQKMPRKNIEIKAIWEKIKDDSSGGSSGGGGGGGSSKKSDEDIHGSADDSQKKTQDDKNTENVIQSDPEHSEWGSEESSNTPVDSSDKSSEGQEILSPSDSSFTKEQKDAYTFAKENGITTKDTIQSAQMNGKLTRIAMAKMLSQYAINVLGKEPDVSKGVMKFSDVTTKMDKDYDNGVTLAYQLGIMGQNMKNNKFRPNDEVTRAEFATALSRLLYQTTDGEYKSTKEYYIPHMEKLYNEGIISNTDPSMSERRGYVMIMLMRSAK